MTDDELVEAVARALNNARYTRVGREPQPMDEIDKMYCDYLTRAAVRVVREALAEPDEKNSCTSALLKDAHAIIRGADPEAVARWIEIGESLMPMSIKPKRRI